METMTPRLNRPKGHRSCAPTQRRRVLAFGALILIFIVFSSPIADFLTGSNISGILIATAVNGILAIGVTFVIITGGIDLSIGTVMTLTTVMMGKVITDWGLPIPIGLLAGPGDGYARRFRQWLPDRHG